MSKLVLARRETADFGLNATSLLGGLGAGMVTAVVILLCNGLSLTDVVQEFIVSTFLRSDGLSLVMVAVTPLILSGLAGAVALAVRFWNIGIEGQMWAGAAAATAIALYHVGPDHMRLMTMGLAATIAGATWIVAPLVLRYTLKINEIITTLLLNHVALLFTQQLLFGY
jgi:simple sugar transport system permease protein